MPVFRTFIVRTLTCLIFSLIIYNLSPVTAFAADPPNPQPCTNAVQTDNLTDNFVTNDKGEPPSADMIESGITGSGTPGTLVPVNISFQFTVNFSTLQSIFQDNNANYIEGAYQAQAHRHTNITGITSTERYNYNGPLVKAAPKVVLDKLRINYIKYVSSKPTLPEAANTFTDINGKDPKTIADLVNEFGLPSEDSLASGIGWANGWGRYWEKIPTSYSEFYEGELSFSYAAGKEWLDATKIPVGQNGTMCPMPLERRIKFIVPEFFRTAAVSGQLNQLYAPKTVQPLDNDVILAQNTPKKQNVLASVAKKCLNFATNNPVSKAVKKAISFLPLNLLDPLNPLNPPNALAEEPLGCVAMIPSGKEGQAPYCALPPGQLTADESCTDQPNDIYKLDSGNTNVVCTFNINQTINLIIPSDGNGAWDSCSPPGATRSCTTTVYVFPNFRLPFLENIWNKTLYSTEKKPGVYSFLTPLAVIKEQEKEQKDPLQIIIDECAASTPSGSGIPDGCENLVNWGHDNATEYPGLEECIVNNLLNAPNLISCFDGIARSVVKMDRNLPGQVSSNVQGASTVLGTTSNEGKQKYIGATDCGKHYTRDIALKPKVLQNKLNIEQDCSLQASATQVPPEGNLYPSPPPGGGSGCDGSSSFASLLPSPIPASVNPQSPAIMHRATSPSILDAARYGSLKSGVACEILIGLHYVEASWWADGSWVDGFAISKPVSMNAATCTVKYGGKVVGVDLCEFPNLATTAFYAGEHFKEKVGLLVGTNRAPVNFQEMIGGMSFYNGGGNSNCGESVPYAGPCPPPFVGHDDPYAIARFDSVHANMYLIYCKDGVKCSPPESYGRDGAATAAKEFYLR